MRKLAILLLVLASPSLAVAQTPRDPSRLFPREATVEAVSRPGLVRLPLTAELLEGAQPDLSDVRLYDAEDREIPYLVDARRPPPPDERRYAVVPEDVERRVDDGPGYRVAYYERFVVRLPPTVGRRVLELDSPRPRFVRAMTVRDRTSGDVLARGSVFRLPSPLRERRAIVLPDVGEEPVELVVELRGEGGYLEPRFDLVVTHEPHARPVLRVPLEELDRRSEGDVTIVELARPPGLVPERLRFETTTGAFSREVQVHDLAQGRGDALLGTVHIYRVPEVDGTEVEGVEELSVPIASGRGDRLQVTISDLDSPALEGLRIVAELRGPALVFEADGRPVTVRYGGGRARAPRYDLASLADRLGYHAGLPEVTLGPSRANPRFDDGPALRFAMVPGREVDEATFTHRATLRIEGAEEGLAQVTLPQSVLAAARADRADLRVLDASGRQQPYLWGDRVEVEVEADVSREREGELTRYTVALPAERVVPLRLSLQTPAEYVARRYEVQGLDATGHWVQVGAGTLRRDPSDVAPLVIELAAERISALRLEIQDGDDAPLAIDAAQLSVASWPLFVAAPDGEYAVLVGDEDTDAPTYEIERARALVLAVRAVDVEASEATPNAAHVSPPWWEAAELSTWAVWGVLLFAMLILGLLTLRVARQPSSKDDHDDDEDEDGGDEGGEPRDSDVPPTAPLAF